MSKINVKIAQFSLISCLLISTFQLKAQKAEPKTLVDIPLEADKTLFYSSNKTGTYQIYKKNDSAEVRITQDDAFNYWGVKVAPDKKKFICYRAPQGLIVKDNNSRNSELWLFNIDGSKGQKLISLSDYKWRSQGSASWSPDGKHLIMAAEVSDKDNFNRNHWHLFLTDSMGKKPVQLSTRSTSFSDPVFSPNGKYITYSALPTGTPYSLCPTKFMEIYVAQIDSASQKIKNERKLTSNEYLDGRPSFLNDNEHIAYSISPGCVNEVEYVDLQLVSINGKSYDLKTDKSVKTNAMCGEDGFIYFQYRPGLTGNSCIARIKSDGTGFTIVYQGSNFSIINPQMIVE
ncbi:hypothetical protein NF867_00685 [Solitalea sp. MAHUQ-68]|uniref:WD40-like Beta Propeller Repeat n=1 Tax=Solitalea agri TaxID=2953739 RepID=A0A9X2F2X1_9SPHI|nr:hypothetical protein [Solitalea agri]MCO4291376.1 hypothetical protein [Solitalea agri]